jgi:hypothetical protein
MAADCAGSTMTQGSPPLNFGAPSPFVTGHKCGNYSAMQYAANMVGLDATAPKVGSRLRAFVVYEDVATGKMAKETCDVLAEELGAGWRVEIEMFSFKSLYMRRIQHFASAAATHADLVVFSCYDRNLPFEVRQWTESSLDRPAGPTALVALLVGARCQIGPPQTVEKYLAALAQRHGMEFFSDRRSAAAGSATGQLMPLIQKEPNDDYSSATVFGDHNPSGLYSN